MNIGEKIKLLRIENGLTQEELAIAAETTKQTIHKYETGIISNIPASKIKALADKLKTTPAYLMGWDEPSKTSIDDDDVKVALFGGGEDVPDEVWDEVKRFAQYAKERYGKK